ncbi:MAG: M28 family peptidase [Candidatus Aminicenantes bacterium]
MKRIIGLILVIVMVVTPASAGEKKASFDVQAAWDYIRELASDSMMGRKSGQPSAVMAEDYIACKFREWGLETAGDNDTYYQNFTIEHFNIEPGVVMEILTERERRQFHYGDDWRVQKFSGAGHFNADVVFVGYGIHAPDKGYDDYAGVDVKGKLALFASGSPPELKDELEKLARMENRVKAAQDLGAVGVCVFQHQRDQSRYFRVRLKKEMYKPDFVILTVEDRVAHIIFKDLNTEIRHLYRQIDEKNEPMSLATGVKAFIAVNTTFDAQRPTRNILAKITGMDKHLKRESVIIGAHMDHLGINPLGEVMNGANDNASGTAVVMEVARIMKLNHARPRRTVIFALWAGEEQGLLGSRYYTDHPTHPIEKTVAYINMDMVGHGSGKIPFRGVYYGPRIWEVLEKRLPQKILDEVKPGRGGPGGSDHTPFLTKGVPGFFIITQGAIKYHHSRDDSDLIKPEMLKKTGDFVHAAVNILASEPVDFIKQSRRENFYLKYQKLVNFHVSPLQNVLSGHKDAKDSHVDLQLAVVEEKEGLSADELRMDILKNLLASTEQMEKAKGLVFYSDSHKFSRDIRQGKTTVMAGLKGLNSVTDDPRWFRVLARQGLHFVIVEKSSPLFDEKGVTDKGKKMLKALNRSGLLLVCKGLSDPQGVSLLSISSKPVVLLSPDLPGQEVAELVKKKKSAWGLIMRPEDDPRTYFGRLNAAKKILGSEHLMIVNQQCLWNEAGKSQVLPLITEILKAEYERTEISNVFSDTLLRVLSETRGEESRPFAYIPF